MNVELFSSVAPVEHPRGAVILAHGFGEHRGRYSYFIEALNAAGYDTWSFDFTGHGTSAGKRARVDVRKLIGEHLQIRREVLRRSRTERLFLFGHSMGGLITLASALLDPTHIEAVAVTGPALRPLPAINPKVASAVASPIAQVAPWIDTIGLDTTLLSRDPQVEVDYLADPLVYTGKVPLLTGATMVTQGDQVIRNAAMLSRPTLILHGEDDGLADFKGSLEFAERAGDLVEVEVIPGAYHELLNEPDKDVYSSLIVDWFDKW